MKCTLKIQLLIVTLALIITYVLPANMCIVNANDYTGEIRWDFIEGTEGAGLYTAASGSSGELTQSNDKLNVNIKSLSGGKQIGFVFNEPIVIDRNVHDYIIIKAELPNGITGVKAYLYNSELETFYGWENYDSSISGGSVVTGGMKTFALRLDDGRKATTESKVPVASGEYNKLEIRFNLDTDIEEITNQVITVDYVAISAYNKDAVLTGGSYGTSTTGTDEKPVMISGINVGNEHYALNETANGYTICGMSSDYANLASANISATAANGWTVGNTSTTVTALENHKVVDTVVTATNGSETNTASYRYVFYLVEMTEDSIFTTLTTKVAVSVDDKCVNAEGIFDTPTAWSYNGIQHDAFLPIRAYNSEYTSNSGGGRDENIGISTFDFSASKDFADEFVVSYNMWATEGVYPSVYLVPDNATKISDCTLLGKIAAEKWNTWEYSEFDVTDAVIADDDGVITLGLYVTDEDYGDSNKQLLIQHNTGTRCGEALGTVDNLADLVKVPTGSKVTVSRTVVEGSKDAPVSIIPIIAHYNVDNQLVNCALGQEFEHTGTSTTISVALDKFSYSDGDYLKAFYWSNMTDITPVLDAQGLR